MTCSCTPRRVGCTTCTSYTKPCCTPEPPPQPKIPVSCYGKATIDCETAGFSVNRKYCTCSRDDVDNLYAYVRRLGQCEWFVRYKAWGLTDDGRIEFRIDDHLMAQPHGRYEVEFRYALPHCSFRVCGRIELFVPPYCDRIRARFEPRPIKRHSTRYPDTPPSVLTEPHMFSTVQTLSLNLCGVFEIGATMLPVSPADASTLCSLVLCKPVELVLDDGVNTEVVTFSGCSSGQPVVARGSAGTTQRKFPKGTSLSFKWTSLNTTTAIAGC